MAKLVGIRVEVFSFGYGKRLFGFKKGDTDYRISLLPMGGYVKFLGEGMFEPGRELAPDDMMAKTRGQRFLVMAMGSIMNILLAIVIVAVINRHRRARARVPGPEAGHRLDRSRIPGGKGRPPDRRRDPEHQRPQGRDLERRRDRRRDQAGQGHHPGDPSGRRRSCRSSSGRNPSAATRWATPDSGQDPDPDPDGHGRLAGREGRAQAGDVIAAVDGEPVYFYKFIQIIEKNAGRRSSSPSSGERSRSRSPSPRSRKATSARSASSRKRNPSSEKYGFFAAIGESVQDNTEERLPGHPFPQGPVHRPGLDPSARRPARDRQLLLCRPPHGLAGHDELDRHHQPPARRPQPLSHPGFRRRPDLRPDPREHLPAGLQPQGPHRSGCRSGSSSSWS